MTACAAVAARWGDSRSGGGGVGGVRRHRKHVSERDGAAVDDAEHDRLAARDRSGGDLCGCKCCSGAGRGDCVAEETICGELELRPAVTYAATNAELEAVAGEFD
jgi:hypothetical protein